MSESQGNNTLNRASSNMPVLNAAPNSGPAPTPPPSNNMPFTATPVRTQPTPQAVSSMPRVGTTNHGSAATVSQPISNPTAASVKPATAPTQSVTPTTTIPVPHPTTPATQPAQTVGSSKPNRKAKKTAKTAKAHAKVNKKNAKTAAKTAATTPAAATPAGATSRQIDFFAEQNARTAAKKAKNSKIIKRAILIGAVILVLVIAGMVGWVFLFGNKDTDLTVEEINNLRFTFGDIYDADNSLEDVRKRYDEIMNTEVGRENADAVKLQLLFFYVSNGFMARGVEVGETIDAEKLSQEAKAAYYNQMYNAYATTGQIDKAVAAQYEAAMLRGDSTEADNDGGSAVDNDGDDNGSDSDDTTGDQNDSPSTPSNPDSGSTPQTYTCDGIKYYSFPVECAVNGVEPNEF